MMKQKNIYDALKLTVNQRHELDDDLAKLHEQPYVINARKMEGISEVTMEAGFTLISEPIHKHIVIMFNYTNGNLAVDAFKEYTPEQYKIYKQQEYGV